MKKIKIRTKDHTTPFMFAVSRIKLGGFRLGYSGRRILGRDAAKMQGGATTSNTVALFKDYNY